MDFNTSELVQPSFELKTILFHAVELLSSNHLELVTKLCPKVEWLSLDSALFYNLEGLGCFPHLKLLRLNYKGRPVDQTVLDFFSLNGTALTTLHLFSLKDLRLEDLRGTVGTCPSLETLVMQDCSLAADWDSGVPYPERLASLSRSLEHLQLMDLQTTSPQLLSLARLLPELRALDLDQCGLDAIQSRRLLAECLPRLRCLRCPRWTSVSNAELDALRRDFRFE